MFTSVHEASAISQLYRVAASQSLCQDGRVSNMNLSHVKNQRGYSHNVFSSWMDGIGEETLASSLSRSTVNERSVMALPQPLVDTKTKEDKALKIDFTFR